MQPRKVRLERPSHIRFDEQRAQRATRFFREHLRHTKGRFAGKPFDLRPWQEHDIREIYGRVDQEGNRVIRQVYKEIPKKNGKSEEAAGHALKLLLADDEPSAEVYGAAADRGQASIVFAVAASMVRHNPKLLSRCKIIDSTKRIVVPREESFYAALSSKVAGKHGYNSHGVIFDEIHAQSDYQLWEVLTFGAGAARSQPLTLGITTAGIVGESPVAEELHDLSDQILRGVVPCPDHFYPVIYAAPDDADWTSEDVWYDCNPLLKDGIMRIESVREEFSDARNRPSQQNSFKRFRLNQWVRQESRWLDLTLWDNGAAHDFDWRDLRHLPCYMGLDLSTKLDVTALVLCWIDGNANIYWHPEFWIPKDNMADRPNIEADKYRAWEKAGHLTTTPGSEVDYRMVRARIIELAQQLDLRQLAFDPAFAGTIAQQLREEDGIETIPFRQSITNFTEPCTELESALAAGRFRPGRNPLLRWMADCVAVKQDANGGVRPVKPDRRKTSKRIDGIVAGLMATSRALLSVDDRIAYSGLRVVG